YPDGPECGTDASGRGGTPDRLLCPYLGPIQPRQRLWNLSADACHPATRRAATPALSPRAPAGTAGLVRTIGGNALYQHRQTTGHAVSDASPACLGGNPLSSSRRNARHSRRRAGLLRRPPAECGGATATAEPRVPV